MGLSSRAHLGRPWRVGTELELRRDAFALASGRAAEWSLDCSSVARTPVAWCRSNCVALATNVSLVYLVNALGRGNQGLRRGPS